MPTYEYECQACWTKFEREQRITEDALKRCPSCGKFKLKRLVGTGNFVLKGGGWYADLYSSPPPPKADKAKTSASGEKAKGDGGPKDGGKNKGGSKPSTK